MSGAAARLREQAVEAARLGRIAEAGALHARAAAATAADASILNSAAFFFSRHGEVDRAIGLWRRAITAEPGATEPLFNLALTLTGAGQAREALTLLVGRERRFDQTPRYWSIRAGAERVLGRKRDALASFDKAARLEPENIKALHGRARMALETGVAAADHYRAVVEALPGDRDVWLGYAQALDAEHRGEQATSILTAMLTRAPQWVDALELLARLRWSSGEHDRFADHYASAARTGDPAIYASWCRVLAGVDRHAEAAEIAAMARRALGDSAELALIEAGHLGEAGADQDAGAIFAALELDTPGRWLQEARHWLRVGDPARAETLAARVTDQRESNVSAWALRGIAWRLLDDPRGEWLHGQPGLVASVSLGLDAAELAQSIAYLDRLHDDSAVPVGQSVREGTQTRGGLFDRHEPEARRIEQAFAQAIDIYRAGLPPPDPRHPLLRHQDARWSIAGSWSIRLVDAGHHVPHIHPNGLVSSAAYFAVPPPAPDAADDKAGWLELGRPPVDLRLDLPPLISIEPRVGECALFPSTLYHGTRAFRAGKRMSAAIDINLDAGA